MNGNASHRPRESPKHTIRIALVGKYVELHDAYISVREALKHASLNNHAKLEICWIHSGELEKGDGLDRIWPNCDGILGAGRLWLSR